MSEQTQSTDSPMNPSESASEARGSGVMPHRRWKTFVGYQRESQLIDAVTGRIVGTVTGSSFVREYGWTAYDTCSIPSRHLGRFESEGAAQRAVEIEVPPHAPLTADERTNIMADFARRYHVRSDHRYSGIDFYKWLRKCLFGSADDESSLQSRVLSDSSTKDAQGGQS